MSDKTLITGATGFVGSAVARLLRGAGHTVRAIARPGSVKHHLEGLDLEFVAADLNDSDSLKAALQGCRTLFHVAADYRLWLKHPEDMYRTNVEGTRALMQAALDAGVERIVYTSSVAVMAPKTDGSIIDEDAPSTLDDMIGPYKRSKFLAEEVVKEMIAKLGLPAVIVNPSTPVGPRDVKPTPTGRVIVEAASGRMPAYVDTGLNLAHVDDIAAGHLLALEKGKIGERYILGGENLSLIDMLKVVCAVAGKRAPKVQIPRRALYPVGYMAQGWAHLTGREPFTTVDSLRMAKKKMYFTAAKAERELGYRPRPANEGLADAVAWFRQHGYVA
jgi:dihydroflavonol-4-reductase